MQCDSAYNMIKKLFIGFTFIVLLGGALVIWQVLRVREGQGLTITAAKPDLVTPGIPFPFGIDIANESGNIFNDAQLTLELQSGIAFVGSSPQKILDTRNIGRIGVGTVLRQGAMLIVSGGEQSIKKIHATVSYVPEGLSSRFEKSVDLEIVIGTAGIALDMITPERATSGSAIVIEVSYKNVAPVDVQALHLKMEYPPTFEFMQADLKPDIGNNVWSLGGLRSGSEMKYKIRGNLVGAADARPEFHAVLSGDFNGVSYDIAEKNATVEIVPSPLELNIFINEGDNAVVGSGDDLRYQLQYKNTSDTGLRNAVIVAELKGEIYELGTLRTNGTIGAQGNTIVWTQVAHSELAIIPPHKEGVVEFQIQTKKVQPVRRLSDRNFMLSVNARIESLSVPKGTDADKTIGVAKHELKVLGDITIATNVLFRDAAANILNRGPIPLHVGTPTNFTVHWILKNWSTDVSGVEVRTVLQPGVRLVNQVQVPRGKIEYQEAASTVTWTIDKLSSGSGVIRGPLEAIFQIEAIPSPTLARLSMPLLSDTIVQAKDEFTGVTLEGVTNAMTTATLTDPTVTSAQGIVAQ